MSAPASIGDQVEPAAIPATSALPPKAEINSAHFEMAWATSGKSAFYSITPSAIASRRQL
jgi:hypothetical protein